MKRSNIKIAVPSNEGNIGKVREKLYSKAFGYIKIMKKTEDWFGIIAISESIICDRMESKVNSTNKEKRFLKTLEANLKAINTLNASHGLEEILDTIKKWKDKRNQILHEMVKVRIGDEEYTWEDRLNYAKETALEGEKIARMISNKVR